MYELLRYGLNHIRAFVKSATPVGLLLIPLVALLTTCVPSDRRDARLRTLIAEENVQPLDPGPPADPALFTLGEALFFDKVLSGNRDISCATCHHPALRTGDGLPVSIGTGGSGLGPERAMGPGRSLIPRNAPEVYNRGSAAWRTMFWDGRALTDGSGYTETPAGDQLPDGLDTLLATQAMFPVTSADEMRGAPGDRDVLGRHNELAAIPDGEWQALWDALMTRLLVYPEYVGLFAAAYPDVPRGELSFAHAANALAAYQAEAFAQHQSPWYHYLQGDNAALSNEAKEGALLFFGEAGCAACHSGSLLTDQSFYNLAVPQVGPGKGEEAPLDFGRFRETGDPADKFAFRTPSLHNVAVTGPWMHNGAYSTLEAVIRHHLDPAGSLLSYDPEAHLPPAMREMVLADPAIQREMLNGLTSELAAAPALEQEQIEALIAFLEALTDPAVFDLSQVQPDRVPSGLPVED